MEREKRRILDTCKRRIARTRTRASHTQWCGWAVPCPGTLAYNIIILRWWSCLMLALCAFGRERWWLARKNERVEQQQQQKGEKIFFNIIYLPISNAQQRWQHSIYIYPEQQPKNIYTSNMFYAVTSHQPVRMFLDRYTLIIFSIQQSWARSFI
jgi:hypothetical protein